MYYSRSDVTSLEHRLQFTGSFGYMSLGYVRLSIQAWGSEVGSRQHWLRPLRGQVHHRCREAAYLPEQGYWATFAWGSKHHIDGSATENSFANDSRNRSSKIFLRSNIR